MGSFALPHEDARGPLVRVAAVFQFQFFHILKTPIRCPRRPCRTRGGALHFSYLFTMRSCVLPVARSIYRTNSETLLSSFRLFQTILVNVSISPIRRTRSGSPAKLGMGAAVAAVGMDKAALACNGLVVFKEEPFHGIRVAAVGFQNGQLILHCAVLHLHNARDARREVGESGSKVRVRSALAKPLPAARWSYIVSVWSPLVTMVVFAQHAHGRVDDEGRVLQLGGVRRFGNDAAVLRGEHAVAAVCAAAHDKNRR